MNSPKIKLLIKFLNIFMCFLCFINVTHATDIKKYSKLVILTNAKAHLFSVITAQTPFERRKGLQGRTHLSSTEGMLFKFKSAQIVNMWMKNTSIPLDMIFISSDGTINEIVSNTTPFSTKIIRSAQKVVAVLEILGGNTKKLGIVPGDIINHRVFKTKRSISNQSEYPK